VAYFDVTTENTRVFRPVAPIDWDAQKWTDSNSYWHKGAQTH
jgi:hypothetical protein